VPRLDLSVQGSHVRVSGGCPVFSLGPCRTTTVVHVPPGVPVEVRAHSGDVSASGLSAHVRLRTSSGAVDADDLGGGAVLQTASGDVGARSLAGNVALRSSSGDVSADDLTAPRVSASTHSGDLSLEFTAPPRAVTVRGHSGDIHVVVPASGGPYAVDAETTSGDRDVGGIPSSPRSDRVISAHTGSGDVTVEGD
jgi:DUF4097 and DUF4098 domain-containing protein YvlB